MPSTLVRPANLTAFRTFPDHHAYTRADVADLTAWARQQAADCVLVTTQKDLVKLRLPDLAGRPLWALRIQLQGHGEDGTAALDHQLRRVASERGGSSPPSGPPA